MATEDLCLVCADTLDYTGFGPCGHKDACSRCVARLRFVMDDTKCMICKQDNPQVFFTRYMGDYTEGLAPDQFVELPSRARAGELYELPEVNGYFDDQDHYKTIKSLCSYTHPMVPNAMFGNLNTLKRKLQEQHKLHFCDLCIKGRKVFISEQVLYSKLDLEKHMRTGDDAGPLAESGFKGHPLCRFCKQRFYDGDELYKHMESRHEHCFICRKLHPQKFIYYKDYDELEDHFRGQHHPCPHPNCLERKFVVFAEEAELKRHFATEHAGDANMSRAQRRQALSINIQLNYSREEELQQQAAMHRPGVVIGGGHNLPRRGGMRHSRSDGAMAAAVQASIESSQVESAMRQSAAAGGPAAGPSSVTFSAEDFPSVSGQGTSGTAPLGTWVGASAGPSGSASLNQEDFPALPSMSRNQRRKQRERERSTAATLAGRLAAASAPIRVVNRAVPGGGSSSSAAAGASSSSSSGGLVRHSSSTGSLPNVAAAAAAPAAASSADVSDDEPSGVDDTGTGQNDFPALGGAAPATQAHPAWVPVRRSKPPRPGQAAAGRSRAAAAAPSPADFPSLAAVLPASSRQAAAKPASSSKGRPPSPSPVQSVAAAVAASGGVSEELKAANKALIEKCKAALSEEGFREFREQSGAFMQGTMSADNYHSHVVQLGLLQLVPQLAALCPDAAKRAALVAAHRDYLETSRHKLDAAAGSRGWVPPEAAMAALQEVEQKGSWACERCTLINAPSSRACEVCSAPRPKGPAAGPPMAAAVAAASSSSAAAAAPRPFQWTAMGAAGNSSSSSAGAAAEPAPMAAKLKASAAAARPAAAAPAPAPAPASPASTASWPSLAGPSSSRNDTAAAASSASAVQQQQPSNIASDSASSSSSNSSQTGKKKKGTKTSLQDLLASGKTHPQNAWTQPQRLQQVTQAGQQTSMGQWKGAGGAKLAKKISGVNDAWSK